MIDSGRGFDHLSGFHSCASGPHNWGLRLDPMMVAIICVPLGIGIASISLPFLPLIGAPRGKIMSWRALHTASEKSRE